MVISVKIVKKRYFLKILGLVTEDNLDQVDADRMVINDGAYHFYDGDTVICYYPVASTIIYKIGRI